jgi:GT2 family glycosyltransferase
VTRPAVDVVIPFAGGAGELEDLLQRLAGTPLRTHDSVVVVDNRSNGTPIRTPPDGSVRVLRAGDVRSSYHARNRGAAAGRAPWLLFLDADVEWSAALLDRYFEPEPDERTGVLGGAIEDAPLPLARRATFAERYAVAKRSMRESNTLDRSPPYAQTANCLVRRVAFDEVGGFADDVRSGGDADLCFRLQSVGWRIERRAAASVIHRNRPALVALLIQKARHGSGAAWLEQRYPGTFPRQRLRWLAATSVRAPLAARRGEPQPLGVVEAIVEVLVQWAFELGRLAPNRARRR